MEPKINKTLQPIDYYLELDKRTRFLRGKDGRTFMKIWYDISDRSYANLLSRLYNEIKPSTFQEFFTKYLGIMGVDNLTKCVEQYYAEIASDEISFSECFDLVIYHTVIQTMIVQKVLVWLADRISASGLTAKCAHGYWSTDLDVGLMVMKNGKVITYIQVKPISYFSNSTEGSKLRNLVFQMQDKKIERINALNSAGNIKFAVADTIYMLYDYNSLSFVGNNLSSIKWAHLNGNPKFHLTDLCDSKTHRTIHEEKDFEKKAIVFK